MVQNEYSEVDGSPALYKAFAGPKLGVTPTTESYEKRTDAKQQFDSRCRPHWGLGWSGLGRQKAQPVRAPYRGAATTACELEQKPQALDQFFLQLHQKHPQGRIAVCLEQSRGPVHYALMKYDFVVIYPVNPRCLADFRRAFKVSGAKADPTDADLLSELGCKHHQRLRALVPEDLATRQLRFLVEARRDFVNKRTALANELTATLKSYYPLALEVVGENLEGPMGLEFLRRWPNLAKLQGAKPSVVRAFDTRLILRAARTRSCTSISLQTAATMTLVRANPRGAISSPGASSRGFIPWRRSSHLPTSSCLAKWLTVPA